jgi:hypothetical protein
MEFEPRECLAVCYKNSSHFFPWKNRQLSSNWFFVTTLMTVLMGARSLLPLGR